MPWLLLVTLGLCVPGLALAAKDYTKLDLGQLTDMDVVYGASRYEQRMSDAPSAVTVITDREISDQGYTSLAEILSAVRGFYVTNDRNYSYSGVRGFNRPGDYSTRVLVMLDGHRLNDNITEQGSIGRDSPVDVDAIERIEVIRGPSSSLYGSDAMFAVINVITRKTRPGVGVSGVLGNRGLGGGRLYLGSNPDSRLQIMGTAELFSSRGDALYFPEFDSPATNGGRFEHGDNESGGRAYLKAGYGGSTLIASVNSRLKRIPTASFNTLFNDPRTESHDYHFFMELQNRREIAGVVELLSRESYDYFDYHGTYPYGQVGDPVSILNADLQRAQWAGFELRATAHVWHGHRAIIGGETRVNLRSSQEVRDLDPAYTYLDDHHGTSVWAIYAQDEWRLRPWIALNAGARLDDYGSFGISRSPRAAVILDPIAGTTCKLLWGDAFRAPTVYELFYDDGGFNQKGNQSLNPERLQSYEFVLEQRIATDLHASLSAYNYDLVHLIAQTTDPTDSMDVFRNSTRIEAVGIEAELAGRLAPEVRARISYAYAFPYEESTHAWLTNAPKHLASASLRFPLPRLGMLAGVEGVYVSQRLTLAGARTPAYFLTHATLSQVRLPFGWNAALTVRNLFDTRYSDPGSKEHVQDMLPAVGRELRLRLGLVH